MEQALALPRAARAGAPGRRFQPRVRIPADTAYALAFILPYAAVFAAFVVYPVVFGLWLGSRPDLYEFDRGGPRWKILNQPHGVLLGTDGELLVFGSYRDRQLVWFDPSAPE